jgi:hypothetical protein
MYEPMICLQAFFSKKGGYWHHEVTGKSQHVIQDNFQAASTTPRGMHQGDQLNQAFWSWECGCVDTCATTPKRAV